jgi:hypothetical protein
MSLLGLPKICKRCNRFRNSKDIVDGECHICRGESTVIHRTNVCGVVQTTTTEDVDNRDRSSVPGCGKGVTGGRDADCEESRRNERRRDLRLS